MTDDNKLHVREALFDTIRNQIDNNSPKETRETFERLVRQGYTKNEAMRLIASEAFILDSERERPCTAGVTSSTRRTS
ncbi:MAG TPA: hypothetical protein VMU10_12700 [Desulfomonilia bacterium]|nr:hypothetical protein [Desulfomonilia bacterium]